MTNTEREPQTCRTCGFTDCPGAATGNCPRWPAAGEPLANIGLYGNHPEDKSFGPSPVAPSDAELEARADDLYTAIMAALDSLPAATWTPEYREAKRQVQAMEIEFRAVCLELSTRLHARSVAWNELPDMTGGQR